MEPLALILILIAAPLVVTIVMAFNAKKINAQWRERRAEKSAARG